MEGPKLVALLMILLLGSLTLQGCKGCGKKQVTQTNICLDEKGGDDCAMVSKCIKKEVTGYEGHEECCDHEDFQSKLKSACGDPPGDNTANVCR
mmetsp:Transcript_92760/g.170422  ORF Transcript_92760/g.170422 Transcript_92760/m.170422 type:complete len:94 (-) Transcript_92760:53-334(-)